MYGLIKSETFDSWLSGLRDRNAKARIEVRIRRLGLGNPGDVKPVGEGGLGNADQLRPRLPDVFPATRPGSDHLAVRWGRENTGQGHPDRQEHRGSME